MKNYNKEIEELEVKLKLLKEEKKKFDLMQPNYQLAEILHEKLCHWNHTDGCGWYYEKWEGFGEKSERQRYLDKANKILEGVSYKQAVHVIENL